MTDRKKREKVINGLEMSYKYSSCDEDNTIVPQRLVLDALALLKAHEDTRIAPRKPYHTKVAYKEGDEEGYWITDQCPECVERGELGIWDTLVDRRVKYCCRCGQALDWSEYNERDEIDWDEYISHVSERAKRIADRR